MTSTERTRRVSTVLWVTLALNWLAALLKIIFGWMTNTMVIMADGFHSLSDGTSNIIGLIAISVSGHPADEDHPYGHDKYETLASIVIAMLLLAVAYGVFYQAFLGLREVRHPEVTPLSFIVMGITLLINLFTVWYERQRGKKLQSEILLSDSWHTLTDIFITMGIFVALIGIHFHVPLLDPLFSMVIAVIIAYAAFHILKDSSDVLCDKAVFSAARIAEIVKKVPRVNDCHEIRTRGRSHAGYVDLHVLVDPQMSVKESHDLANIIEHDIKEGLPGVQDVVVHIEPTTHEHNEL
jgi:cation diffusion facilitator family transporter